MRVCPIRVPLLYLMNTNKLLLFFLLRKEQMNAKPAKSAASGHGVFRDVAVVVVAHVTPGLVRSVFLFNRHDGPRPRERESERERARETARERERE